jgi:hypothetical protein
MFRKIAPAAIFTALCFGFAAASAQQTSDAESACTPDVFRLCSNQIPNRGKIVACLRRNKAQLSPGCKKIFS